jgi:putative endonuclease
MPTDFNKSSYSSRKKLGQFGEQQVADWLEEHGYTIVERNYRKRCGEIDIIAHTKDTIAFVEVKRRKHNRFALSQVVTPAKQRRIIATAKIYINLHLIYRPTNYRFDIALVQPNLETGNDEIEYFQNAFTDSSW